METDSKSGMNPYVTSHVKINQFNEVTHIANEYLVDADGQSPPRIGAKINSRYSSAVDTREIKSALNNFTKAVDKK